MEVIEDADEEVVAERSGHRWDIIGDYSIQKPPFLLETLWFLD